MSPEKEAFLKEVLSKSSGASAQNLMPFMMAMVAKAKQKNLSFTTEEAMMLFSQMKGNLSKEEQDRLMQIYQMLQSPNFKK